MLYELSSEEIHSDISALYVSQLWASLYADCVLPSDLNNPSAQKHGVERCVNLILQMANESLRKGELVETGDILSNIYDDFSCDIYNACYAEIINDLKNGDQDTWNEYKRIAESEGVPEADDRYIDDYIGDYYNDSMDDFFDISEDDYSAVIDILKENKIGAVHVTDFEMSRCNPRYEMLWEFDLLESYENTYHPCSTVIVANDCQQLLFDEFKHARIGDHSLDIVKLHKAPDKNYERIENK